MHEDLHRFISQRIAVPAEFENVFTHFYEAGNNTATGITQTLFPSFQTILAFSFGTEILLRFRQNTQIKIGKCIMLGPIKQPVEYILPAGAQILVANFKDDAFYRFFGQALAAEHIPKNPDEWMDDNCFTSLWHSVKKIDSTPKRVTAILEFCRPYLKQQETSFTKMAALHLEGGPVSTIKTLAQQNGQTERTIQGQHKKYLGYSAKELTRYKRFLKAIELLQTKTTKIDWFDIINDCGYYDQSQLIHDFKHYINLSPTQYLKFQQDICMATPA